MCFCSCSGDVGFCGIMLLVDMFLFIRRRLDQQKRRDKTAAKLLNKKGGGATPLGKFTRTSIKNNKLGQLPNDWQNIHMSSLSALSAHTGNIRTYLMGQVMVGGKVHQSLYKKTFGMYLQLFKFTNFSSLPSESWDKQVSAWKFVTEFAESKTTYHKHMITAVIKQWEDNDKKLSKNDLKIFAKHLMSTYEAKGFT